LTTENGGLFSYPLLMKSFSDYERVKRKVLYVGKETKGWIGTMNDSQPPTVDQLMESYQRFEFAKSYHGRRSPFWRFVRTCHNKMNGEEFPNGLLWTNFSKCDSGGTTPNHELQKMNNTGFDLIVDEIQITKPEIVIFMTGRDYEHQFQRVFSGLEYKTLDENYLYRCIHPALPAYSYRTMHPNWLQFKKRFDTTLGKIVENVASGSPIPSSRKS
jgi:hypothetical protein